MLRRAGFIAMSLLSVLVAAYAIGAYGFGPGAARLPRMFRESFGERPTAVAVHIFCSAAALMLGPLQFSAALRGRRPRTHRILGRIYLGAAVPLGGLAGLYLSVFAYGGIPARLGFGGLAVAWLYTGFRGYAAALARDFHTHRRWMIRNYSLTFAAVTLRAYIPISVAFGAPFEVAYPLIAWLCWAPNLALGERLARAPGSERDGPA